MSDKAEESLFVAGKAKWLLDNAGKLTPDQRALLLAVASLELGTGRKFTEEERNAIDKLTEAQDGYDPKEIEDAVQYMIQAKTKGKVVDWPSGLWRRFRRKLSR